MAWDCGFFFWEAPSRILERVLNMPLIILKLLSPSPISNEAYSEPSQTSGIAVSARIVGLSW